MKKFLICMMFTVLWFHQSSAAEEMDILANDLMLGEAENETMTAESSEDNVSKSENQEAESNQNENNGKSSWFGFITRPLSKIFSNNAGDTPNEKSSETALEKSIQLADEGNLEDQMNLAYMYLYGTNGVKQDYEKAFKYYSMAAKQDDPIAINNLGSLYFNGIGTNRDVKTALTLFEHASDLGNDNASINLAFILLTGGTKDPKRNRKAMELFQKAQKEGNKIAKFMVGYAYYKGFVYPQEYNKAFKLIRSAATENAQIDEAQLVLSDMYVHGHGTTQNYELALSTLLQASTQGNLDAIIALGDHYRAGDICKIDLSMAHTLFNIAAAYNVPNAGKERDIIGKNLKIEDLTKAQKNAQEYQPSPSELTLYIRQTYGNNLRYYIDNNFPSEKDI